MLLPEVIIMKDLLEELLCLTGLSALAGRLADGVEAN
jgi:hypothetical protein